MSKHLSRLAAAVVTSLALLGLGAGVAQAAPPAPVEHGAAG